MSYGANGWDTRCDDETTSLDAVTSGLAVPDFTRIPQANMEACKRELTEVYTIQCNTK